MAKKSKSAKCSVHQSAVTLGKRGGKASAKVPRKSKVKKSKGFFSWLGF